MASEAFFVLGLSSVPRSGQGAFGGRGSGDGIVKAYAERLSSWQRNRACLVRGLGWGLLVEVDYCEALPCVACLRAAEGGRWFSSVLCCSPRVERVDDIIAFLFFFPLFC